MNYEEITSKDIAFKAKGLDVNFQPDFSYYQDEYMRSYKLAEFNLEMIISAINGSWVANNANTNQPKYYIWWSIIDNPANKSFLGRGLSLYGVFFVRTATGVAPCLCFESEEKSRFAAKIFLPYYEAFYFAATAIGISVPDYKQIVEDAISKGLNENQYEEIAKIISAE